MQTLFLWDFEGNLDKKMLIDGNLN